MRGLRPAFSTFLFLLLITGGVYPLLTTLLGQWWFPWQANGSLIREGDTVRGSALIGQNFTDNGYFHGRPSATAEMPYNPQASGGSNLAVSNPALNKQIAARVAALRAANPDASASVRLNWSRLRQAGWTITLPRKRRPGRSHGWRKRVISALNSSRN